MDQTGLRFSIRAILITTAYVAIALAALVKPNTIWLGIVFGTTILLLFYSLLGAIYRTEHVRAFWTGFAVFGFGYLAIVYGPFTQLSAKLPTTLALDYTRSRFHAWTPNLGPPYYPPLFSQPVTTYIPGPASAPSTPISPSYSTPVPATLVPVDSTEEATADIVPMDETTDEAESVVDSDAVETFSPPSNPYAAMPSSYSPPSPPVIYYQRPATVSNQSYDPSTFPDIGQGVCAMLFAALGGVIAQCLFVKRSVLKPR